MKLNEVLKTCTILSAIRDDDGDVILTVSHPHTGILHVAIMMGEHLEAAFVKQETVWRLDDSMRDIEL